MPQPRGSAELATSPRALPPLPSSSAPSPVSALSAAASDLSAALKLNLAKKRRQSAAAPEADGGAPLAPVGHRRPLPHPELKSAGSFPAAAGASRSTVLTMTSSASWSERSASAASSVGASSPMDDDNHSVSSSGSNRRYAPEITTSPMHGDNHSLDGTARRYAPELTSLPQLSADKRRALVDFIDRSVDDAYNLCHGFGRVRWTPSKTREGVTIHRARGEDDSILDAAVRGKCNVTASFNELMDLLVTETTDDFVSHEMSVNPTEFLDGQVLYTLVPRTAEDRFVCVKWHCVRSLAPSVAKHRDYVYVEVVDRFKDGEGKQVGYRLAKSVELEELPPSETAHLFVRAKTLTLTTFADEGGPTLELHTMMINDLGERLPSWLVHKVVETAAMRTACIRDYINQRRIDFLVYANPKDMVPLTYVAVAATVGCCMGWLVGSKLTMWTVEHLQQADLLHRVHQELLDRAEKVQLRRVRRRHLQPVQRAPARDVPQLERRRAGQAQGAHLHQVLQRHADPGAASPRVAASE